MRGFAAVALFVAGCGGGSMDGVGGNGVSGTGATDGTSGATDGGAIDLAMPPAASDPRGKGIWIWDFATHAGDPATVAAQCASWGVGFVLIKSGEDDAYYNDNFDAAVVAEFTSRGIQVYGWPYVRPGDLDAKVSAIAEQARVAGVSGIILDVEGEFVGAGSDATTLCRGIRAAVPGIFLGYTSFGWVEYHTDFPYQEFDADCGDAFLPQTYWDEWTTGPVDGLAKGVDGAKALGLKAPVWAAQDNYNGASVDDLNAFFQAAGPHASLWRWPDPGSSLLDALPQLDWKN